MSDGLSGITRPMVSRSAIQARGRQTWRSTYWRLCFRTKTKTSNSVLTEGYRARRGSSIRISSLSSWQADRNEGEIEWELIDTWLLERGVEVD